MTSNEKITANQCFLWHKFTKWQQAEEIKIKTGGSDTHSIYKQVRQCQKCGYIQVNSQRVNNY